MRTSLSSSRVLSGSTSTVNKATPTLTTSATATATAGQTIQDMATLAGGVNPGGTITFTLYGPDRKSTRLNSSHVRISYGGVSLNSKETYPSSEVTVPQAGRSLFFFNDTATTEIYTLSLHDALPI